MNPPPPRDTLKSLQKLAALPKEIRQNLFALSITRLTSLKRLCQSPEVACRFAIYLGRKVLKRAKKGRKGSTLATHYQMMTDALAGLEAWAKEPSEQLRRDMIDLQGRIYRQQDEHRKIRYASVRLIYDKNLLLFELALSIVICVPSVAGRVVYQLASRYCERYEAKRGSGLTPSSIAPLRHIIQFLLTEYGLSAKDLKK